MRDPASAQPLQQPTPPQTDTVPSLDDEYRLSAEQIEQFRSDGCVCLPSVASRSEVDAYRGHIARAALEKTAEQRSVELADRDAYGKAFLQGMNLWETDEVVRKFVFARRFARLAAALLGVHAVRLYHDQALFKEPGGGMTPWHQDQFYWPLDTNNTLTMWMALTDATADMGPMRFARASHLHGSVVDQLPIGDQSHEALGKFLKDQGAEILGGKSLQAGDATFHYGWTVHGAGPNQSSTMREAMTIIYFADGARVTEPQHHNHRLDIEQWLPELQPGDLAASFRNPVLYESSL